MIKALPLFASVAMVAFSGSSAMGATLVGSELKLRLELQRTPTSELLVSPFPASAIVSESAVEFPNAQSLGSVPGFSIVNVAIDAGADYLELDYPNAGFGRFSNTFKNTYVFTFSAPVALQITEVLIDPSTTLGLTPDHVTFDGNELSVNVRGLSYNRNSFVRLNLSTVAASEPDGSPVPDSGVAVPEPSSVLSLGILALAGSILKWRTKRNALQ
ncbi:MULTISPECIES: PEP-CTERM sorting domain-containing protein [unclassified Coleofasciculus]|uniref:PEP-CTERM sorting domain-containing protein n=1 Tax=unclassified Coleofasciculus TaxID=2692782 RepID=UPI001881DBE7|nr:MULTISPECIES: PEP-CTERM sorting domain-containing protein [unclassified Coleofasciculus]MBE9126316.1 PEP-CTERM sorting domain-containing protein [Coleofasciculus sp. LEGE 07081]MBE9147507.1 PEP-CTERM sorting domain-containing protein [Coleofasciculus sp. LEGE 07092]